MNQEWLAEFNRLYEALVKHFTSGVEEMASSAMQGMPLDTMGTTFAEAMGGLSVPRQMPLEACYRLLGLSPTASWEEVKRRYRELSKRLHPDVAGPETAHLFAMVTAAYTEIEKHVGGGRNEAR